MGIVIRVIFLDDDRPVRIPHGRFERLWRRDPETTMPSFAGRRVRCALFYLEFVMRKPAAVAHIDYMILHFDRDGRLDEKASRHRDALAIRAIDRTFDIGKRVVAIAPRLASSRYRKEFQWKPTPETARAMLDLSLKR